MKTVGVIGWGSIARRYAENLKVMGHHVVVLTKRDTPFSTVSHYEDFLGMCPDLVVVANQTAEHGSALRELRTRNYHNQVVLEKPLDTCLANLPLHDEKAWVAYHLRFHPVIQHLRALLKSEKLIAFQSSVGQHLSQWRPGRDYRECYSAKKDQGGGVLRDLSHELDLLWHLVGPCQRLVSHISHTGALDIETEDRVSILMEMESCPHASIHLDYLDHLVHRDLKITTQNKSFHVDLLQGTLKTCDESYVYTPDRDQMMRSLLTEALKEQPGEPLCTYQEGLETMKWIEKTEESMELRTWVEV